jgi:hypothetical protein
MTKLFIATPMFGGKATVQYAQSLLALLPALRKAGVDAHVDLVGNESLIQRARNLMSDRFHKSDCTHLLFIDADIGFSPEQVLRLIQANKDIATGVYPKKHIDLEAVKKKKSGELGTSESVESVGLDYNLNIDTRKGMKISEGFVQCLDSATGFMLVSRKAYQAVWDAHPELECKNDLYVKGKSAEENTYRAVWECMIDPVTKRYLSEDFAFCRRAQEAGQEVWCDLKSQLSHTGSIIV